jgi:hypothetical protein
MGQVTITLPSASPEAYLRWIDWWRESVRYMVSSSSLARSTERRRGSDPVLDLSDHELPDQIETAARHAIEEGKAEVAPEVRVDAELLQQARRRNRERVEWLESMQRFGAPALDSDLHPLRERTREVYDQALAG